MANNSALFKLVFASENNVFTEHGYLSLLSKRTILFLERKLIVLLKIIYLDRSEN